MIKDIRQSKLFAEFMQSIGWEAEQYHNTFVYFRKFPIIGYFAKIPRPLPGFSLKSLRTFRLQKKIFELRIAPFIKASTPAAARVKEKMLRNNFQVESSPFNPTTTILIDLKRTEDELFHSFSPAKRRAVRRALKNGIAVKESTDIQSFISLRKYQYRPLGFLVTKETETLFGTFYPKNATLLLAYQASLATDHTYSHAIVKKNAHNPIAGILLLMYDKTAYYWFASALPVGKKLFAPTLLVWEALKIAKRRGCSQFDFEGIYDPRFPKAAESWKGFTKFKEGFGGKKVVFIENFKSKRY